MNTIVENIINALESNEAKPLLSLPFAIRQYSEADITGVFSYNLTNDPQDAVEDVEFDFNEEYICYPVFDVKVDRDVLVFNCSDPIASCPGPYGFPKQLKQSDFMSAADVLKMLKSSPAFQDVKEVMMNVGDKSDPDKYGSCLVYGFYTDIQPSAEKYNVVKLLDAPKDALEPYFSICTVGDIDVDDDKIDFYSMPWSSTMAMDAYFKYQADVKSMDDRYYNDEF